MRRIIAALLSLLTVFIVSTRTSSRASSSGPNWTLDVRPLTSPAAPNSAQPQLSALGNRVVLSWVERAGDTATLRFSDRTDSGWTEAQTVASGTNWFVNWADVPSVIPLQHESMAAHWLQKSASGTYAYDVRLAFSRDRGRTWAPSVTPHHDGTKTEHGFASLFPMATQGLGVAWLDGRQMKEGAHEGTDGGSMSLGSRLRGVFVQRRGDDLDQLI